MAHRGEPPCIGCGEARHLSGQHDQGDHAGGRKRGPEGAGTEADPIRTTDVYVAAVALSQGKVVDLRQPLGPSMQLRQLKTAVDAAKRKGALAGPIDLCRMTVEGSNVFCAGSLGIERARMPQLSGVPRPGSIADSMPKRPNGEVDLVDQFVEHMATKGVTSTTTTLRASYFRPAQREMEGGKVAGMSVSAAAGQLPPGRIVVTSDGYIVDGHHRYAVKVADELDGRDGDIEVLMINAPITSVLNEANKFTTGLGLDHRDLGGNVVTGIDDTITETPPQRRSRGRAMMGTEWCDERGCYPYAPEDSIWTRLMPERDDRAYGLAEYEVRSVDGGRRLEVEGYAAVFGQPARIVDRRGQYMEQMRHGAFAKHIREQRNRPVPMLWEHGKSALLGTIPLSGPCDMSEDTRGLHFRGRFLDNWLVEPIRQAVEVRAVTGMSVGFAAVDDFWTPDRRSREVREAILYDISPVLEPAYVGTELALRSLRSLDRVLHDVHPEVFSTVDDPAASAPGGTAGVPGEVLERMLRHRLRRFMHTPTPR